MADHEDGSWVSEPLRDENPSLINSATNSNTSELNVRWESISELGIRAKTGDGTPCGNVICTYRDNIVVIDFGNFRLLNEYIIPISRIKRYDGKYIYLSVPNETNLQPYVY